MVQEIFKNIVSKSPIGKITFLDTVNIFKHGEAFDEGEVLDLSDPAQAKRIKEFFNYILSAKVNELPYNPRPLLDPAGRIWVQQEAIRDIYQKEFQANIDTVISFWADKDKVTPKHFQDLVDHFKLIPQNTMVEFLGDVEPSTRLDTVIGSSNAPQPELSKEEQEEREKRKAASLAKVHVAAAGDTKDKDVQAIIDKRKKAMADVRSRLRASGARPSLADRQRAMSSESFIKKPSDQILLEEAYQSIRESQKLGKMTPQQEHVYARWESAGWEFEMWDGEDVIMQRWDRSLDGASRLASMRIKPDGEHYREKFNSSED